MYRIKCRSLNFTRSTRSSLFFNIFNGLRDIRFQRISKVTPLSKLGVNIGAIVMVRGGPRFEANRNHERRSHVATYTEIFIQIGQLFRNISTDKLFAHTDRQAHTRPAKNQFSWRFSVSGVRKCVKLNVEFLTVFQSFHSFYEHGSKKGALLVGRAQVSESHCR